MRWKTGRRSRNVEDRRGQPARRGGGLPGGLRLPVGGGRGSGCTTILIILALMYFLNSGGIQLGSGQGGDTGLPDLSDLIANQSGDAFPSPHNQPTNQTPQNQPSAANDPLADFVSVVLADTEDVWKSIFAQLGRQYQEPRLVLFSNYVRSACGMAQSASGPFYCPADQKLYIDLSFYEQLKRRHKAPGDFAQAYVIAHEVGHHVQTLLGISQQVQDYQRRASKTQANQMLVRLELQADCFSGVWANHAHRMRQILEEGDIEEALNAAAQIGDDTLQRQSQGYVVPESFTHGTAKQRASWFKRGLSDGDIRQCDTFKARQL